MVHVPELGLQRLREMLLVSQFSVQGLILRDQLLDLLLRGLLLTLSEVLSLLVVLLAVAFLLIYFFR